MSFLTQYRRCVSLQVAGGPVGRVKVECGSGSRVWVAAVSWVSHLFLKPALLFPEWRRPAMWGGHRWEAEVSAVVSDPPRIHGVTHASPFSSMAFTLLL